MTGEPLTKDKMEEIDKAMSEHLDECVRGKVSVWDECNCEACTVCFEIASQTKEGQEGFERDKIIFHHAFASGWNGREKNVLSAVRLLQEKVGKFKNNAEKEKFTKPFAIGQRDGQIGAANQFLQYIDEVLDEVGK